MSATDELRRLLDERGVKWWPKHDIENGYCDDRDTEFLVYGCKHVAHEWGHRLNVDMLTPTQAIEAILGREECEPVVTDCNDGLLPPFTVHCSACGDEWGFTPNYCPNCGRKVR